MTDQKPDLNKLNELVAEKVMGWKYWSIFSGLKCDWSHPEKTNRAFDRPPPYSTDPALAFEALMKAQEKTKRGIVVDLNMDYGVENYYMFFGRKVLCYGWPTSPKPEYFEFNEKNTSSLTHALCLAALKMIDVEVDDV